MKPSNAVQRMPLAAVRVAAGKTQVEVAQASGFFQPEVSRMEKRSDMRLSNLRRYAAALGAECEVTFVFPTGERIVVTEPVEK
jgi:transcriptional regulator with XRE-family HTH domain